jgi:hypothetical protein
MARDLELEGWLLRDYVECFFGHVPRRILLSERNFRQQQRWCEDATCDMDEENAWRAAWQRVEIGMYEAYGRLGSPVAPLQKIEPVFKFDELLFHRELSRVTIKPDGPVLHRVRIIRATEQQDGDKGAKRAVGRRVDELMAEYPNLNLPRGVRIGAIKPIELQFPALKPGVVARYFDKELKEQRQRPAGRRRKKS